MYASISDKSPILENSMDLAYNCIINKFRCFPSEGKYYNFQMMQKCNEFV